MSKRDQRGQDQGDDERSAHGFWCARRQYRRRHPIPGYFVQWAADTGGKLREHPEWVCKGSQSSNLVAQTN